MSVSKKNISAKSKNTKAAKPVTASRPSRQNRYILIFIFIFSFCIYANSIRNNYAYDDIVVTLKNKFVQNKLNNVKDLFTKGYTYGFNGINTDYIRPIPLVSLAFEVAIFGNAPHFHHFINVLLFSLSCVILFLLLKKLFIHHNFILPLIVTLLYSSHPIHTEVVANIKSRDEIFCFLFLLLGLYYMMVYLEKKNIYKMILSCVFYLLSLLSKENAVTFVILFPMVIFYFTETNFKRSLIYVVPYVVVLLIYFLFRFSVIDTVALSTKIEIANNSLMAAQSYSERMATAFLMLGKYLYLLVLPFTLSCDYSYNSIPVVSWGNIGTMLSFLIYAGAAVYALITLKKKDHFSFAILFFIITFSATSNIFILINCSMAERFLYTSSLSFCLILGLAFVRIFKVDVTGTKKKIPSSVYLIPGVIVLLYSFRTMDRNGDWKDNEHLFLTDVKTYPENYRLHNIAGITLKEKGDKAVDASNKTLLLQQAIEEYKKSLEIYPKQGAAWYDLAVCSYKVNEISMATSAFRHCLEYDPNNVSAINDLGVIFFNSNNLDSAFYYFNKAVQIDPKNADALLNVGVILFKQNKYDEAIAYYERSMAINPDNANLYNNLAQVYEAKKEVEKAEYYRKKAAGSK
jgi:protein O-mannosyl-transferase